MRADALLVLGGVARDQQSGDAGVAEFVQRAAGPRVDAYVRTRTSRPLYELRHASVTALLVTRAAAENEESVGTHNLVDEPATTQAD